MGSCPGPLHKWLLGSYLIVLTIPVTTIGISYVSSAKSSAQLLVDLRQKSVVLRAFVSLTWRVVIPIFAVCTLMSTRYTWQVVTEAPQCMPTSVHLAATLLWQLVSYLWLFLYCGLGTMAWLMEHKIRRAERDLRDIADSDMEQRWGDVSNLEGYTALPTAMACEGLAPSEIRSLPGAQICSSALAAQGQDCSICLSAFQEGDQLRKLSACGHTFHKSCADLWLLRSSACPMCKVSVKEGVARA